MPRKYNGLYLLLLFLISACSTAQHATATSTRVDHPITGTPRNTSNPLYPVVPDGAPSVTPTLLPIHTTTPIVEGLSRQCFEEYSSLPKEVVLENLLGIQTLGAGITLLDLQHGTQRNIDGGKLAAGASSDGKWLVTVQSSNQGQWLLFESMEGNKPIKVPVEKNWYLFGQIRWLDEQRIWFIGLNEAAPAASTVVINPFTNQKDILRTNYPGINAYQTGPDPRAHFGSGSALYEPSLRYVIYPELAANHQWFQTLWDRKAGRQVARIFDDGSYGNSPIWQDDQERFLLVGFPNSNAKYKEWLSVGIDGKVSSISEFGKLDQGYRIENNGSLSPDGKTLAFGLNFEQDGVFHLNAHLVLLDLSTGKAADTCIPVGDRIVWSLDGRFLAISTPLKDGVNDKVLLVDPKSQASYPVFEGKQVFPIGWLIQP